MLTVRIIPCLDVEDGRVVKGIKFKNIRDAGDPVTLAGLYDEQGADEIIFLDIAATHKSRKTMIKVVKQVSKKVFVPLTVGGGIRNLQDMRDLLNAGADKVSICSAALKNPKIICDGSQVFGSQCLVLSIDAQRVGDSWNAFIKGGREDTGKDALIWAKKGESLGAGEILLNSMDADGTREGYDLELTRKVSSSVSIPVIASGGAGDLHQIHEAIEKGRADAVLIASLLHYKEYSIQDIKNYLRKKGVPLR